MEIKDYLYKWRTVIIPVKKDRDTYTISVMKELWRICKDKARIKIIVPHFESLGAYVDPTHYHFFTYYSFEVYSNESCKPSFDIFDY